MNKKLDGLYGIKFSHSFVRAIAFTLAETLIVMGVIGVVAALTLPNLNQSTNNKEKVAKLLKVYSSLSDAYGRATAVYGPVDEQFNNDTCSNGGGNTSGNNACAKRFGERLTEFMKISKVCGISTTGTCFASGQKKNLAGTTSSSFNSANGYKFVTNDNVSMYVNFWTKQFNSTTENNEIKNAGADIHVDIDGPNSGSNTDGKDLFCFVVTTDGIVPRGVSHTTELFTTGSGAAEWIIENGNMDYLTCPSSLAWETKTSCKQFY